MDVLIIGYGKIGRIKAFIWQSLGRRVSVYDVDIDKKSQAQVDGFGVYSDILSYKDLVVDISTPAALHLQSLRWVLEHVRPLPRSILIEKPLVSDRVEWSAMQSLFNETPGLKSRIIVNESYYLSSALNFIVRELAECGPIISIDVEMSKNRLPDVTNGRFVDEHLGSLGIELPHMIAMIEALGISVECLRPESMVVYQDRRTVHNEGFTAGLIADGIPVGLSSYLGNFRVVGGKALSNESIIRLLTVKTALRDYRVLFDPVEGLGRYKAKITVNNRRKCAVEETILDDNHLAANLKKIHENKTDKRLDRLLAPDNALEVTNLIFRLKGMVGYHDVPLGSRGLNSAVMLGPLRTPEGVLS